MKATRAIPLIGCRGSLCCLQFVMALCLASCASAPQRTAQRASDREEPALAPVKTAAVKAAAATQGVAAVSTEATTNNADQSAEQSADAPQTSSSKPAADVADGDSKPMLKNSTNASATRGGKVVLASAEEPEEEKTEFADQSTEKDPSLPPSAADGSSDSQPSEPPKVINLVDAPLEEGDKPYPITLASAMKLSDARPLVVAAAQARAWVAEAQLQRANVIWVPQFNLGGDYIRHDGYGPDFNRGLNTAKRPLSQNINFLYMGTGFTTSYAITDAVFEPLAAKQVLKSKRADIQSAKNDALLATANAYFSVHEFRGQYAGALDVVKRGEKLVERIGYLSEDLVPRVEVDRAKRLLANVQQNAAEARQKWRVSSANLTQVLRLDPRVVVEPAEHDHTQITFFDPARTLYELIPIALTNRPELASQQAMVAAMAERIRREKGRILLPSFYLNGFQTPNEYIQGGVQAFGGDGNLNLWSARSDFSLQPSWQLDALGLGNLARIKEQRGEQSRAIAELFKVQDMVAADVTRAQARVQSTAVRTIQAERALKEAITTYDGNFDGLAQTKRFENVLIQVYRPQEAVIALNDLVASYDDYFTTVVEYNRAQFQMYHALGYPAVDISEFHTPGEAIPVDTSRPQYLPAVEAGPPAASR